MDQLARSVGSLKKKTAHIGVIDLRFQIYDLRVPDNLLGLTKTSKGLF